MSTYSRAYAEWKDDPDHTTPALASFFQAVEDALVQLTSAGGTLDYTIPTGRDGITVTGNADPTIRNGFILKDFNGNPIWYAQTAGGMGVNDNLHTDIDLVDGHGFIADIYGNVRIKGVNFTAGPGVPGNHLSFTTACMENFQGYRLGTVGDWTVYSGCTIGTVATGNPGTGSTGPDGLFWAMQMTATSSGLMAVTSPGGIYSVPVTPGSTVSAVASFKAVTTARPCFVGVKFFDSNFTYIPTGDVNGAPITDDPSVWKQAAVTTTVPANASYAAILAVVISAAANEQHQMDAVGFYPNGNTIWNPPMVNQTVNGTRYQGASTGDRYFRTDGVDVGSSEYVCLQGGYPNAQIWQPIGSSGTNTNTGWPNFDALPTGTATTVPAGLGFGDFFRV